MYFTRFNVIFPIVHEPTFVAKECDWFLLLNIFAIGSLLIGTPDAIEQVSGQPLVGNHT